MGARRVPAAGAGGGALAELAREDARHHFHVWGLEDFLRFVMEAELPWTLEHAQNNHDEFIAILRKT